MARYLNYKKAIKKLFTLEGYFTEERGRERRKEKEWNRERDLIVNYILYFRHIFMGYLKMRDKTDESIDELGFLHRFAFIYFLFLE